MARDAINGKMGAFKREVSLVMIEVGRLPGIGVVAGRAGVTEIIGNVVGVGRAVEIGLVTRKTLHRGTRVATSMAIDTKGRGVRPGQREVCLIVIEC